MEYSGIRTGIAMVAIVLSGHAVSAADTAGMQSVIAKFTPAIESRMAEGNIPSLAIALVNRDTVLWKQAFGYANVLQRIPASTDTVYLIGSTFKAQSTVAFLQLVDEGKVNLTDPVSTHLKSIAIAGEDPENPVRIRHLFTHSSGLPGGFGQHLAWGFTAPLSYQDFFAKNLRVQGPPEQKYEYSNVAFQLIAYLAEEIAGQPYRPFIQERLWDRLHMRDTTFVPRPDQYERLAIPYLYDTTARRYTPAAVVKADVWAAGIVYGTIGDQANWLMMNLNRGAFEGERIISNAMFKEMMKPQFHTDSMNFHGLWGDAAASIGLTWWLKDEHGDTAFAHSGSVDGYTAWVSGNLDRGFGVVMLTNGDKAHPHLAALAAQAHDLLSTADLD